MEPEITPEPTAEERLAILAALALEEAEQPPDPAWSAEARPSRAERDP
jgi:hypothetical protein